MIMKKLIGILIIAFSFYANKSMSQIQRGNVLVGGDLANFKFASGGVFDVNIDPKAAFFLKDNFALGAYINFGLNTAKDQSTITTYGIGPLARYYINDPKTNILKHGRLFFEGNVGIEGNNTAHVSTNGLGLGIGPGYAYFISPNVGLETLLKYNGIVGFGSQAYSSAVNLGFGFQIYLSNRAQKNILNEVK
jgi:hypothetical protein